VNRERRERAWLGLQPKPGVGDLVDESWVAGISLIAEVHLGVTSRLANRQNPNEQEMRGNGSRTENPRKKNEQPATMQSHEVTPYRFCHIFQTSQTIQINQTEVVFISFSLDCIPLLANIISTDYYLRVKLKIPGQLVSPGTTKRHTDVTFSPLGNR
jgi:hypothetical protein